MASRILMATVAGFALAVPAAAQDRAEPLAPEEEVQQVEQGQEALPEEGTGIGTGQLPGTAEAPAGGPADEAIATEDEELAAEDEAMPPADMTFIEVQEEAQFLADEEVIGQDVVNLMDEEVGEIADLVMDRDQKLVGVVLSVGGFLGLGEKWVAAPVETIEFPSADQPARLVVEVTKEQLENAPDFMTRAAVEAQEAAEQAQQQAMQQQQQIPPPAPANQ
jgi:hypothetical protein